jgi:Holliday junction DNA helicase RuvA
LQAVPGIGKRTAERIIVELREKVGAPDGPPAGARTPIVARRGGRGDPRALAREGLLELGYAPAEADALLADSPGESAEELIAAALRLARSEA